MPSRRALLPVSFAAMFVLAACGGGTTPTTGPGGATQGPAATQSGGGGGGGGGTGDYTGKVCDLLRPSEVEGIMHLSGVMTTETPIANGSGACLYSTSTGLAGATSYTGTVVGQQVFDAYKAQSEAVDVPGIGDDAIYLPSVATTFVLKHGVIIGITAGEGDASSDDRAAWEKEMAKIIAGRL